MKNMKKLFSVVCGFLPIVLLLGCLLYIAFSLFVPGPGGMYSPDSTQLDMRQETLTVRKFQRLQNKLPDTKILWRVPIGDNRYDSESTTLYVENFTARDIPSFAYFGNLRQVNGGRSQSYEALIALQEAYPDLDVRWSVDLGGKRFSQGCQVLRLSADEVTVAELTEKLVWLPELETLTLTGTVDSQNQAALMKSYPDIVFDWSVNLCGETFRSTDTTISFAGRTLTEANLATIRDGLFRFYNLESIDLSGCGIDNDRLAKFREQTGVEIGWEMDLCGAAVHTLATEIDLSGNQIGLAEYVEEALPYFTRLEKVIMSHCGIPDEEMDALNKRYEDIQFVWTVKVGNYELRTDTTNFIATKDPKGYIHDKDTAALKYCNDMVALDLGHNFITDISFVSYMPHMKYFIVAENPVVDLSPLAELEELVFLEIFLTLPEDLTPLLSLTSLRDLNLCHTYTVDGDHAYEVLRQMTWLERLWYSGHDMKSSQQKALAEDLPGVELMLKRGQESVCGNWRYGQHYYDMRDMLDMYYMDEWGDPVDGRQNPPY